MASREGSDVHSRQWSCDSGHRKRTRMCAPDGWRSGGAGGLSDAGWNAAARLARGARHGEPSARGGWRQFACILARRAIVVRGRHCWRSVAGRRTRRAGSTAAGCTARRRQAQWRPLSPATAFGSDCRRSPRFASPAQRLVRVVGFGTVPRWDARRRPGCDGR